MQDQHEVGPPAMIENAQEALVLNQKTVEIGKLPVIPTNVAVQLEVVNPRAAIEAIAIESGDGLAFKASSRGNNEKVNGSDSVIDPNRWATLKERIHEDADLWELIMKGWGNPGYKRGAAQGMYSADLETMINSAIDIPGIMEGVHMQIESGELRDTEGTYQLIKEMIKERCGVDTVEIPTDAESNKSIVLPDGTHTDSLGASSGGRLVHEGSIAIRDINGKIGINVPLPGGEHFNYYILIDSSKSPTSKLIRLLHEYGHFVEQQYGKPFSITDTAGMIHTGKPTSEAISSAYAIRMAEIAKYLPDINNEELLGIETEQIVFNRWVVEGRIITTLS